MNDRFFVTTMLGVSALVLTAGMSPLAQRTDQQAQVRTVNEIDAVGTAMFSWLTDQVGAAAAGQSQVDIANYPAISHADLEILLQPQYLENVPELDGWNHSYELYLNTANPQALRVMAIRSPGRDGSFSGSTYETGTFEADSFDEDIVWADGYFVRHPRLALSDREAQRRTLADIRNTGTALFSWLTDQVGFAAPGMPQIPEALATVHFPDYPEISHEDLQDILVPQYMNQVPERDGWNHAYDFRLNVANPLAAKVMAIRSPGRDGAFSGDSYTVTGFDPDLFDEDIAWTDGFFARWPQDPDGLSFYTVPPCRAIDTRNASALQSGVATTFPLGGACGIPIWARAVAVNVTVLEPTGVGHVTLFPGGLPVPSTSTINFATGQTRANSAIATLSVNGLGAQATVAGNGQVHLLLDVSGYFE